MCLKLKNILEHILHGLKIKLINIIMYSMNNLEFLKIVDV